MAKSYENVDSLLGTGELPKLIPEVEEAVPSIDAVNQDKPYTAKDQIFAPYELGVTALSDLAGMVAGPVYGLAKQYKIHFRETLTYGEYLLATRIIPIVPCGPLFKCYHWKEMYDFEAQVGLVNVDIHKKVYLGVVLQSNWT